MNQKLIVWILVGPPGSGKTTFGQTLAEEDPRIERVCPDEFQTLIGGSESNQAVVPQAFLATKIAMKAALTEGKCVIVDATNMYRKARKDFIDIAHEYGAKVHAVVFELDKATVMERIKKRVANGGRDIPEKVIDDMLAKYQRPEVPEFDEVTFINKA